MSKIIKKLNDLKIIDSYLQINFPKGYKYIDRAGEIVNSFYKEGEKLNFRMNREELVFRPPDQDKKLFKLSVDLFWIHNPKENLILDQFAKDFVLHSNDILRIIDVNNLSRIGWRNHFILEPKQSIIESFRNLLGNIVINGINGSISISGFEFNFTVKEVLKNDDSKTPSLLFDVDGYKKYPNKIKLALLKSELTKLRQIIQSAEFIKTLNSFIEPPKNG